MATDFVTTVRLDPDLKKRLEKARGKQPVKPTFNALVCALLTAWCKENGT
jgi:hypothetical protein